MISGAGIPVNVVLWESKLEWTGDFDILVRLSSFWRMLESKGCLTQQPGRELALIRVMTGNKIQHPARLRHFYAMTNKSYFFTASQVDANFRYASLDMPMHAPLA